MASSLDSSDDPIFNLTLEEANALSVLRSVLVREARSPTRDCDGGETTSDCETDAFYPIPETDDEAHVASVEDALSDLTDDAAFILRRPTPRRIIMGREFSPMAEGSDLGAHSWPSSCRQATRQRNGEEEIYYVQDDEDEPDTDDALSPEIWKKAEAYTMAQNSQTAIPTAPTAAFGRIRRRLSVNSPDAPARKTGEVPGQAKATRTNSGQHRTHPSSVQSKRSRLESKMLSVSARV